jgi:hypothetical protein
MINIVGFLTTKLGKTVGIALAVVVILFLTTKSIQNGATDSLRRATPDADAARQWLLDRQQ